MSINRLVVQFIARSGGLRARRSALRWIAFLAIGAYGSRADAGAQVSTAERPVTSGDIVGSVSLADSGQPAQGVRVSVDVNGAPREVVSDEQGRFALRDVASGTYVVLAQGAGYAPLAEPDVVVSAGRQTQVVLAVAPVPNYSESVVVTASAFSRPPDAPTGAHGLSAEEIRRAPGGLGDVSRLTQALPGVATSSDQRNDIIARGGSPSENLTVVDGIEVPNLSHFAAQGTSGGPISMLNTELIQSATFLAGGFSATYGDRLSSVLDVSLREGSRERFSADVDLGFAGFGALAEGPLGEKGSYVLSGRRSYLELLAPAFGLTAVPQYTNYQGKAVIDVSPTERVTFVSLGGVDSIDFTVDEADLEDPSLLNVSSSGWRATSGVTWRSLLGDRAVGTLAVSHGIATFSQGVRDVQIGDQTIVDQDSRETTLTAQYDLTYRAGRIGTLKAGVLTRRLAARLNIDQPIGLDNPFSTDPTRVDALRVRTSVDTAQGAVYLQDTRPVSKWLDVTAGARIERSSFIDATTISPRMGLVTHLRPTFDVNVSYGRYTQTPALVFLNADPTNKALKPMRAEHRVVGLEWRPAVGLRMTLEAYQKLYRDYPVSRDYSTLSFANTGDFYGPGGLLMPLVSVGRGRSHGVEFFAQQKLTKSTYGQVAYSWSRTEHSALDGVFRRGGFEVPHVLSIVAGRKFDDRFELSTKFSIASGRPTTPFLMEASREQNRGILDVSRLNAERGPVYQRWDVRMDRRYRPRWATVVTWVEVENIFARKNVYQYVWNPKTRTRDAVHQIGVFIVGGFTFEL